MLLRLAGPALLVALLAPLFVVAERVNPAIPPKRSAGPGARRAAVALAGFQLVWVPVLGIALAAYAGTVAAHGLLASLIAREAAPLRAVEAFLLMDCAAYWVHQAEHRATLLWRLHAVHHGGGIPRWWTSLRFHPLDVVLQQGVPFVVAASLGFGLGALVPYLAAASVVTLFAHLNTALPEGWWSRLVVTPGYHRAHHAPAGGSSGFAVVLPLMDTIFGTAASDQRKTSNPNENEAAFAT